MAAAFLGQNSVALVRSKIFQGPQQKVAKSADLRICSLHRRLLDQMLEKSLRQILGILVIAMELTANKIVNGELVNPIELPHSCGHNGWIILPRPHHLAPVRCRKYIGLACLRVEGFGVR
jgi:hypothetical protein